jgi:tetratricopeptide (TPR) repeat protein
MEGIALDKGRRDALSAKNLFEGASDGRRSSPGRTGHRNRTARLDEAVAAYGEALKEKTRERDPLNWALTKGNLGFALLRLGERESGTARLDEAVAAYGEALKEQTRARVPLLWAKSAGNQGVALLLIAERRADGTMAKTALDQIEAAITTAREGGDALAAAKFEAQVQKGRSLVQHLGKR